ncbi:glucose-6-phosphate isomerase [Striga asiatica]|uniref:Glucose-6-phosphate isomerase n=1 Tax=Striga asiatica TaxID=4170 RepID=A0A5A7QHN9_STRAF|nr:glucose-6-phosphate isomerase [Striga asiatica]
MERHSRSISAQSDWIWFKSLRIEVTWSSEDPATTAVDDDSEEDDDDVKSRRSSLSKASLTARESRFELAYNSDRPPLPAAAAIAVILEVLLSFAESSMNIDSPLRVDRFSLDH